MALIGINKLVKEYVSEGVKTRVLEGLSFSIRAGEFVAIMGPSGSGKSTLLHILGLLDRPTSGEYRLEERSVATLSDVELARVRNAKMGFVFQAFNLLARAPVYDNVRLPLVYSYSPESQWDERVRDAIALVGLEVRARHRPSQLSGGEQQRVAIARALVNEPDIIFADEPTGNLDSKNGAQVIDTLDRLNRERRLTIILVTHDAQIARHARRIIQLKDGKIVSDTSKLKVQKSK